MDETAIIARLDQIEAAIGIILAKLDAPAPTPPYDPLAGMRRMGEATGGDRLTNQQMRNLGYQEPPDYDVVTRVAGLMGGAEASTEPDLDTALTMGMEAPAPLVAPDMMAAIPLPPARPAGSSKMVGALPDPVATPGFCNPDVRPDTIKDTIAIGGWTKKVRPSTSYTDSLKRQQLVEYGYPPDTDPSAFEEDHKVPLCCGGHPFSPLNLWPQPRAGAFGAALKDATEVAGQHAILSGLYSLQEIQEGFMTSWVDLHAKLFNNPKLVGMLMTMTLEAPEEEP